MDDFVPYSETQERHYAKRRSLDRQAGTEFVDGFEGQVAGPKTETPQWIIDGWAHGLVDKEVDTLPETGDTGSQAVD